MRRVIKNQNEEASDHVEFTHAAKETGTSTPLVTVVHSPACFYCSEAEDALAELGREFPLRVEHVAATSETGVGLLQRHRAPMLPLVLLDGALFSHGRLPRRKLRRLLASHRPVGAR